MTPDDGGQDDVGDGDPDLATLANLIHGEPDQDAIERESPRAADDERFGWLESNGGQVVIYDERNPFGWVSSDDPDDLDDRE